MLDIIGTKRRCVKCGIEYVYEVGVSFKDYCSVTCRQASLICICVVCGKEFTRRSYSTAGKYCCAKCMEIGAKVAKQCVVCGAEISKKDWALGIRCCGAACAKVAGVASIDTTKLCVVCLKNKVKRGNVTCSKTCRKLYVADTKGIYDYKPRGNGLDNLKEIGINGGEA